MTVAESGRTASQRRLRPNPRGRGGGRRTRQEQQKEDSRGRILEAAKTVLADIPYPLMAVEDVIAEAKVSRTTFYRHFDSKFAIFRELHRPFLDALYKVYDGLGDHADPTVEQASAWLKSVLDFYRSEQILVLAFGHIYAIEPDFYPIAERIIDTIFERLAARQPAFRKLSANDDAAMAAKIEAHFLLQDINYFGMGAVIRNWELDTDTAATILAGRIRDFIRSLTA